MYLFCVLTIVFKYDIDFQIHIGGELLIMHNICTFLIAINHIYDINNLYVNFISAN